VKLYFRLRTFQGAGWHLPHAGRAGEERRTDGAQAVQLRSVSGQLGFGVL